MLLTRRKLLRVPHLVGKMFSICNSMTRVQWKTLATLAINPSRKYNPCTFKYLKGWKICELIGDGMQCSKKLKSRKSYPGSDKYLEILDKFYQAYDISVI